jgi:hypothetical protein
MRARPAVPSAVRMVALNWWRVDITDFALVIRPGSRNLVKQA